VAPCNLHDCAGDEHCIAKQDVVVALDGSAAIGTDDFVTLRTFAHGLVARYNTTAYDQSAVRIGLLQFGNGEVLSDGSVSPAAKITDFSTDIAGVQAQIEGLTLQTGFPNLAQAFGLANQMFAMHGGLNRESVLIVLSATQPPFRFNTLRKAEETADRHIRIFTVSVSRLRESDEALFLESLGSRPRQGNFLQVPGFQALSDRMGNFTDLIVSKACPHTESPTLVAEEDVENGFTKIAESKACTPDARTLLGDAVETIEDCASLARDQSATHFSYGIHFRQGYCWAEQADTCTLQPFLADVYQLL
jgi:hypothetical protein